MGVRVAFPEKSKAVDHLTKYKSPSLNVICGEWSYGRPSLQVTDEQRPRTLRIGRYCSIAHDVEIFVGRQGRHPTDTLSSYPILMAVDEALKRQGDRRNDFPQLYEPSNNSLATNLDVEIGHDVWIGAHAVIMAGVTIGTGAVIATGAVVAADVPPYAVVGGIPARLLRYRHEPEVIRQLLESEWWLLEPDEIWRRCGTLIEFRRVVDVLALLRKPAAADAAANKPPAPIAAATVTQKATPHAAAAASAAPAAPTSPPAPGGAPLNDAELGALMKTLRSDLANAPVVLGGLGVEDLARALSREACIPGPQPRWPEAEMQRRYAGGFGVALMQRTCKFIDVLAAEGAFQNPQWHGLDFGCGWGRIASVMLTRGAPSQLDICDAWQVSLDRARENGLQNRAFLVPDVLKDGSIPTGRYDFVYAFSIFTHLNGEAFRSGLTQLAAGLKPGGKLFFTVRHEDFFGPMVEQVLAEPGTTVGSSGIWHVPYPGREVYGETIFTRDYVRGYAVRLGKIRSAGLVEALQHLYILEKPAS